MNNSHEKWFLFYPHTQTHNNKFSRWLHHNASAPRSNGDWIEHILLPRDMCLYLFTCCSRSIRPEWDAVSSSVWAVRRWYTDRSTLKTSENVDWLIVRSWLFIDWLKSHSARMESWTAIITFQNSEDDFIDTLNLYVQTNPVKWCDRIRVDQSRSTLNLIGMEAMTPMTTWHIRRSEWFAWVFVVVFADFSS